MNTTTIRERVSRLAGLFAREREALAEFISELADFDTSRAWEELGCPSLFEFLTRELRLSRGNAFYRTKAVALVRHFPQVLDALREGKLCISTIPEVARVVTEANVAEVLPRFFYLSRDDAKLLSVELSPRQVVPVREVITSVARPLAVEQACLATPTLELAPAPVDPATASPPRVQQLNYGGPNALDRTGQPAAAAMLEPEIIEPMTGKLSRVHLSVTREVAAKIKAAGSGTTGAARGSWPTARSAAPGTGSSTITSSRRPRAGRRRSPTSGSSAGSTTCSPRAWRTGTS